MIHRILALMWLFALPAVGWADTAVTLRRVPDGGVQPQVAVDAHGVVHLVYLVGNPSHSDINYSRSADDGATWSPPLRVNSQPGSALAIGTVRGAHLALGRDGRVHVAWMGAQNADPPAPGGMAPMLYARLADDGTRFEPQRNIIHDHPGIDGGGSIAADGRGNVYVAWHAPATKGAGEQDRRVWVARSTDDGKTFAAEQQISDATTGACGCCGMRAFAAGGKLLALYRGAAQEVNRGMYLVEVSPELTRTRSRLIAPMKVGMCVMSTSAFAPSTQGVLAAWESRDQVQWARIDRNGATLEPHDLPDLGRNPKHPALAEDKQGRVLVAWTEGTGWDKGGAIRWQVFDATGKPDAARRGCQTDLPPWDAPAVFAEAGGFVVLY